MRNPGGIAHLLGALLLLVFHGAALGQAVEVIDVPTRPGVTQRFLYLPVQKPTASVVLLAGGHGGLGIYPGGGLNWGNNNFVVRTRSLFFDHGFAVAVVDAPSDRQRAPFLRGFRQTSEHVEDLKAVIAWMRARHDVPVWLVGTSRGTQSAAYLATQAPPSAGGADGIVLTSSILRSTGPRDRSVPDMPIGRIQVPVLLVHHRQDACRLCLFDDITRLTEGLTAATRKQLLAFEGGNSVGDACEALAYHGYNGIEQNVVAGIAEWIAGDGRSR